MLYKKQVFLKTFAIGWGLCFVCWSFMVFQLWWGNHDWGYLKTGVFFNLGFIEARYTQHLPTVLLLDGHVLPLLIMMLSFMFISAQAVLMAKYLEIPQNFKSYIIFILSIVINPYLFISFYYVHYILPLFFWGVCIVALLYITEKSEDKKYWLGGIVGYFLILGSYPPNMALALTLFMAKRCISYVNKQEDIKSIVKKGLIFLSQLLLAYLGFSLVQKYLIYANLVNAEMYNLTIRKPQEIAYQLPKEILRSISQNFHLYTFLDIPYCTLLFATFLAAIIITYRQAQNKPIYIILVLGLCVASRYAFILSSYADIAAVRLEYWGRLGLYLFALSILLNQTKQWIKNIVLIWALIMLSLFIKTDFEIQKVQYLGFTAGRKYQQRLVENLIAQDKFRQEKKYISLTFGNPSFRERYINDKYKTPEMVSDSFVFSFDVINFLFWEEKKSPISIGAGIWNGGKSILKVNRGDDEKWQDTKYWKNNPQNMQNLREWLYKEAKWNSFYIDDKYIIAILDVKNMLKYRNIVLNQLDK